MKITDKLTNLCKLCNADHGINQTCEKWDTVKALIYSLESLASSVEEEQNKRLPGDKRSSSSRGNAITGPRR